MSSFKLLQVVFAPNPSDLEALLYLLHLTYFGSGHSPVFWSTCSKWRNPVLTPSGKGWTTPQNLYPRIELH